MSERTHKSHIKVAMAIMVLATFASLIAAVLAYIYALRSANEQAFKNLEQLALSVENASSTAAYIDNDELAQEIVDGLAVIDIVAGARMTSATGMDVSSSVFQEQETSISLALNAPFYEDEIGKLLIQANTGLIQQSAKTQAIQASIAIIFYSVLLTLFVSAQVYFMLANPLRRLNDSFSRVDPSDPQPLPLLPGHDKDEIGSVTKGINNLLAAIDVHLEKERTLRLETETLERRFRLIFERASAGIAIVDHSNNIVTQNPSFARMLQIGTEAAVEFPDLFVNSDEVLAKLEHVRLSPRLENDTVDLKFTTNGMEVIWLHALISKVEDQREASRDDDGPLLEVILYDITNRIEKEELTRFEADHDSLTHLNNRRSGERKLAEMIERCLLSQQHLVYMMIDLDRFKPVNDNFGHDAGDIVLKEVARRMEQVFSLKQDVCIRWGGDEFAVARIVSDYNEAEARSLAKKLLELLCKPIQIGDSQECSVGASIGIVIAPEHGANLEELINNADHMMYYVKAHGRSNYRIYRPA